jgi:putative NADPH-quinone reductase/1,4-dihydroxy-2-naphthoate octaprenyltransferase
LSRIDAMLDSSPPLASPRPTDGLAQPGPPHGRRPRVLIIVGHPRADSFSHALARAYRAGAERAGVELRELELAALRFDPNVTTRGFADQPVEPDLARARALIAWAEHLVLVYPTWWGTMPALLKGFLDRALAPGFAFAEEGGGFVPLLGGRSAELLTTMDTPGWVWRWIYGAPGDKAIARATLGFCGIKVAHIARFGPIKDSSAGQRRAWLAEAGRRGARLSAGPFSPAQRFGSKLASWLKALRLQFYPMTWAAYAAGAFAATAGGALDRAAFWSGLLCLFFLEAATVLANEVVDYESDRRNRNFGPFTGGSRVLATGELSFGEVRRGIALALVLALLCAFWLVAASGSTAVVVGGALALLTTLALGYTVPPLKLSYRGLGELDVGLTHSPGAILCGFVFQGGAWHAGLPWLLSLPLFLAVLPSITLSGVPDLDADAAVGKRTLAVRTGVRGACAIAALSTLLAAGTALALQPLPQVGPLLAGIEYGVLPHALLLLWLLARQARLAPQAQRIDRLMIVALAYILWFVGVPLAHLA